MCNTVDDHGPERRLDARVSSLVIPYTVDFRDINRVLISTTRNLGGTNGLERRYANLASIQQRSNLYEIAFDKTLSTCLKQRLEAIG